MWREGRKDRKAVHMRMEQIVHVHVSMGESLHVWEYGADSTGVGAWKNVHVLGYGNCTRAGVRGQWLWTVWGAAG